MKILTKLYKFMYGRYGIDDLYKFNFYIFLILAIINLFVRSFIISIIEWILLTITFYRVLSKNINRRRKENQKYLKIKNKIINFFKLQKRKWVDRNTHTYRKCPKCKTICRLPLKKGKNKVICPTCGNKFEIKCRKDEKIKVEIIRKKNV